MALTIIITPILRTIKINPVLYQPPTDTPPEVPIVGDELYGVADEALPPEDPAEEETLEIQRLVYASRNPRTPCPVCKPMLGTVWQLGCQPRLPRHDNCMCFYQETWTIETKNRPRFKHKPANQAAAEPKLILI